MQNVCVEFFLAIISAVLSLRYEISELHTTVYISRLYRVKPYIVVLHGRAQS